MDMSIQFSKLMVVSKPVLKDFRDTKFLTFMGGDATGHKVPFHMWGKYAETASRQLAKGQEISAVARQMPGNKTVFVIDRILMPKQTRISRQLSYWKAMLLIKIEELWPFGRKTPESPAPTEKSLVDMALEWWEENKYEEYYMGDGEYDNLYSEEPDFITRAREIKEEVIIE